MDDIKQFLPMLKTLGISPEQLGPEKMKMLEQLSRTISNPESMGDQQSSKILRDLGINLGGKKPKPKHNIRIGRNEPCLCGSGLKSKKCCLSNT